MGSVSGVYYEGAEMTTFSARTTSMQSTGNVSGSGSWSYSITWDNDGFTSHGWELYGRPYTADAVIAMTEEQQYELAVVLLGQNYGSLGYGCVAVTKM